MALIDVVTYCGEKDLWDIHYNVLKDHVDEFIVCEAMTTFSGLPKPLYFPEIKDKYEKVRYFVINDIYSPEELALAESSPNTKGAAHWKHEFLQKESIKKALVHLNDNDQVVIGDVDEVWEPRFVKTWVDRPYKFMLRVYAYYLDNRSSERFWGPISTNYATIKAACLNHLRTYAQPTVFEAGWHFTSQGGPDALKQKLINSYTDESYATPAILDGIAERYGTADFLGRDFTYSIDTSEWPQYLKDNQTTYAHLCSKPS